MQHYSTSANTGVLEKKVLGNMHICLLAELDEKINTTVNT